MQETSDYIKILNLGMKGIEEGEMVQAKESCSIFNKITKENLPISKKRFAQ
jgi:predicted transcriptional regulator